MNIKKTISIFILSFFITTGLFPAETPEILWRYTTGGRIITSPVEGSDGTIYFGSEDRFLYALYSDGTLKWRLNLKDRITNTLAIAYDGTLYAGSRRCFLIAVNPLGKQVWKIKLKGIPFGNPAVVSDGSLYLATDEGWLYSISHTGFIRWEIKLPSSPVISPIIGAGIYVALSNDRIYSYNRAGGREWVFVLSGNAKSLALSLDSIYVGTDNSTLVAIDFTGKRIWNTSVSGPVHSIVVLTSDRVLCTSGNRVAMLDSSGNILWNKSEKKLLIDTVVLSDGIVSLDNEGHILWLDLNGSYTGELRGGVPAGGLLGSTDGFVYIGSKDWLFYKYGFKNLISSKYKDYLWPSFHGGGANRGSLVPKKKHIKEKKLLILPDYVYLLELASSGNEQILGELLDEIEYRLYARTYDAGTLYLSDILEFVASEGIKRPLYEDGRLVNDFSVIRGRAIEILGITGNFTTINFLTDLLLYEWDDFVLSSIIRSLGSLQSDMDYTITRALKNYYERNINDHNIRLDSQILATVRKMNKYNGSLNIDLLNIITNIFLKTSSRSVKELALDTIQAIQNR